VIVAAFTVTTGISLILYWRISSKIGRYERSQLGTVVDKRALNRLREALKRRREPSAEELLAKLKSVSSEAEEFLDELRRGDPKGEGCSDS